MNRMIHAGLLAALFALGAACDDSDSNQTPTPDATATPSAPATATPTPTRTPKVDPTQRPTPVIVAGRKHVYDRGDTVTVERGTLFLDPATGGGVVWEGASESPSGMYVYWQDGEDAHLVNTLTDAEFVYADASIRGFGLDDTQIALWREETLTIHKTGEQAAIATFALEPATQHVEVAWSDQGYVAIGMTATDGSSLGIRVWRDGELTEYVGPTARLSWAPDGRFLAALSGAAGTQLAIIDNENGTVTLAGGPGSNPRWSENSEYVAYQEQDQPYRVFVFDRLGTEKLRATGICSVLGSPWVGNELDVPFAELRLAVDGSTRPHPYPTPNPDSLRSGFTMQGVEMTRGDTVLAELKIRADVLVSWPTNRDQIMSLTADGRGVFELGRGGRGFCEGVGEFSVETPPFE